MTNDDNMPDVSQLRDIGRDHTHHRASRVWINEAIVMCLASFGLGTYHVVQSTLRNGFLSAPGFNSSVVFGLAFAAAIASFKSLGPHYPDDKRRSLRIRLVAAVIVAALPLIVGIVGQVIQLASRIGNG